MAEGVRFEGSPSVRRRENLAAAAGAGTIAGTAILIGSGAILAAGIVAIGSAALSFGVWELRARRNQVVALTADESGITLEMRRGILRLDWSQVRSVQHVEADERWIVRTGHGEHLLFAEGMSRDDREQLTEIFQQYCASTSSNL